MDRTLRTFRREAARRGGRCSAGRSALRAGFAAYGTRVPKWGRPCAGAPMRVVKRVVVYPSGFSFQATLAARSATEWSGVARVSVLVSRSQREPALVPWLGSVILSLKASGLLSFCSCVLFARSEFACLPDRCRRFVLCWPTCATHQLLSGQLRSNPTPIVSCLNDSDDRGVRPI